MMEIKSALMVDGIEKGDLQIPTLKDPEQDTTLDTILELSSDLWDKISIPLSIWEDAYLISQ